MNKRESTHRFDSLTLQRARAAAALRGLTLAALARAAGCTAPHLHAVLCGERLGSARVLGEVATALGGEDGAAWRFVIGEQDALPSSAAVAA